MARKPPQASVSDFTHSVGLLVRRMRAVTASNDLSLSESSTLGRLYRDGPATVADLARAESVKPQSMGATIAALEDLGLLERTPHPTDGRQRVIRLTAKGTVTQKSAREARHTWLAHAMAQLSREEVETLFTAGEIMRRLAAQ